ncbi:hypothetical protein HMPREF9413_3132 [Paenibacillus sp. HGF7]|nr:hypothetical protein HMPREF9413_3132 [Paenibacillus sp. HGF7]
MEKYNERYSLLQKKKASAKSNGKSILKLIYTNISSMTGK